MFALAMTLPAVRVNLVFPSRVRLGRGPFNDVIQLAVIQPDTTASRAVVDLHALTVGHHQICILAGRAVTKHLLKI